MTVTLGKKIMRGIVVKRSGKKTVKVVIEILKRHEQYNKIFKYKKSYLIHDLHESSSPGDEIEFIATRPISKQKHGILKSIMSKGINNVTTGK